MLIRAMKSPSQEVSRDGFSYHVWSRLAIEGLHKSTKVVPSQKEAIHKQCGTEQHYKGAKRWSSKGEVRNDCKPDVDEHNQPPAPRAGCHVDAFSNKNQFGIHLDSFCCGSFVTGSSLSLVPYTCSLSGLNGCIEKIASTGRPKYSAIWKASFKLGP